jgi:hypothetical protein
MSNSPITPTSSGGEGVQRHLTQTKFWEELMRDIFGPRKGGAIIFVDSKNARKGTAKTSGAVAVGRFLASFFGYDIQKDDLTLAAGKYLQRYQAQPGSGQPSVLVLDELVGAGAGDARRAMSSDNVDLGRAWQLLRTKRVITLATLPDWNEADPRLQKYADYRLWMQERPIGCFKPYKVVTPFNSGGSVSVQTKGLSKGRHPPRIHFPNMDGENDPYYQHLAQQKDELIESDTWDAGLMGDGESAEEVDPAEIERREQVRVAIRLYQPWNDDNDTTYRDVSKALGEKTKTWVGNRVREWKDGQHRDIVADPTEEE